VQTQITTAQPVNGSCLANTKRSSSNPAINVKFVILTLSGIKIMKATKQKQPRKSRNLDVMEMITGRKGGPHRDRREKRLNNPKNYITYITWE